ncbi:hypothetical protein H2203_000397 [Taxawa tesnikishii (nom. ined.)]|nr:hypothetical protein H2203_000397 [Dothideales sp. JES 119]
MSTNGPKPYSKSAANLFRSKRLSYRAPSWPEDEDFFLARMLDTEAYANLYNGFLLPPSKRDLEGMKKWHEGCLLVAVICLPPPVPTDASAVVGSEAAKPIPIGAITLSGPSDMMFRHHRSTMIGLGIQQPYQNQGYGSEAIEWVLHWGFEMAGLHRIGIGAFGWNEGARRLYERMGFVPEGVKREALWFNGGWDDLYEFSMLEGEWRERRDRRLKQKQAEGRVETEGSKV